jgi:clan AA aspartic protease (TIGR02281 family)
MRAAWFVMVLALASGLTGCAGSSDACHLGLVTDLPVKFISGDLLTPVIVNGVRFDMVIDTGARTTILAKSQADRVGLKAEDFGETFGLGGHQTAYIVYSRSLQVGQVSAERMPLVVSDMNTRDGERPADGLLGADFLGAYDIDLNLAERRATLYQGPRNCPYPAVTLAAPLYYAKFVQRSADSHAAVVMPPPDDPRPMVRVRINGVSLLAMVDTGSSRTVMFSNAAHRLGLESPRSGNKTGVVAYGLGPNAVAAMRQAVGPLEIGNLTFRKANVIVVGGPPARDGVDMLLGMDFLSRIHVWFSFSSRELVMQLPEEH